MSHLEFLSQPIVIFLIGIVIYEIRKMRDDLKNCVNLRECEKRMQEQKKEIDALAKQVSKNTVSIAVLEKETK